MRTASTILLSRMPADMHVTRCMLRMGDYEARLGMVMRFFKERIMIVHIVWSCAV